MLHKERERDYERQRERSKETLHLLVHSPNGYNSHVWSKPKAGARGFFQLSHMVVLRLSFAAFPGALEGSWIGSGASCS